MHCWPLLAFPGLLLFPASVSALTAVFPASTQEAPTHLLHLAPDGDDDGPGDFERPYRTPARAQEAARAVRATGGAPWVIVHGGRYPLKEPLVFGPEDSGKPGRPVMWRALDEERPVFSGGRAIGGWTQAEDGTLRTRVEAVARGEWRFRELFVGGVRRPRAGDPDEGWYRVEQAGPDRRTLFRFRPGDLRDASGPPAPELHFLHDWSTSRIPVQSIDLATHTLTTHHPIGPAAAHYAIDHFERHPRFRLENHPAFLDAPGEWFLDEASGELTLIPLPGETPETLAVIAPRLEALLVIRGNDQGPVRHLVFHGLAFEHCAWPIPERGYAAGQACFHEPRRPGHSGNEIRELVPAAVHLERAEECGFVRCRFAHLGGSGLWVGSRCHRCDVVGVTVADVSGNGVMIGETTSRLVDGQPWWKVAPDQTATGNVVIDCTVERVGVQFHGAVGIWAGIVRETCIEHNLVRHTPYTGISIGWRWSTEATPARHNQVARNHIHDVMQVLSDGGGVYTLGRQPGSFLIGNHIHHVPLNLGRAESNGMFLDEGTTGFQVAGNLFHNLDRSPLRFHRATTNLVSGNVFVLAGETPPVRYNATDPADISQEENRSIEEEAFDLSDHAALVELAGPRRGH